MKFVSKVICRLDMGLYTFEATTDFYNTKERAVVTRKNGYIKQSFQ